MIDVLDLQELEAENETEAVDDGLTLTQASQLSLLLCQG